MKKLVSAVLAATVACSAFMFAGCGGSQVLDASSTKAASSSEASAAGSSDASAAASTEISGNLTLNGSTSMAEVCQALGEAFMKKYPNVKVDKSGNGSGDAPKAVEAGTALIGDLSRKLKDEEKPDDFDVKTIAIDGIAIAVNKDNKVKNLTTDQITKIFTGAVKNWKEVGGDDAAINVIGRESASGTRDGFESIFKCKEKCKYASELTSTGAVKTKVSSDKAAVGYISLGNVDNTVTAVKVDGVDATEDNINNGTYKAHRPFIEICKKGSEDDLINAWFTFVYSEEGKKIIQDCKLIATDEKGNGISAGSASSKA
ncbi:phosphate ABC transporter substrate-binding protein [Caproicibacterium amylolyticum]|uniref:Phosphate-binding protein n=1 Tax=Caproicibacterium amylolyticum TaxID=2766537 RepID=A0A7G9WEM8_9FIRM|nr:phosphate ABC transporter substrate-binding protein [Caproicibacterium amylolyticum]QNO17140.1 phosphate ABC transporter substrate-binding protein [Caproicibacterium amylolyticum]